MRFEISGSVEFELEGAVVLENGDEESFDMEKSLSSERLLVWSIVSGKLSVNIITGAN